MDAGKELMKDTTGFADVNDGGKGSNISSEVVQPLVSGARDNASGGVF